MILSLLFLSLAIGCYTLSQLHQHGRLKWVTKGHGFFGENSYLRKYKNGHADKSKFQVMVPLDNWYYNLFKVKYREAFPLSSTILVFTTDFYHLAQFMFFNFLSLSVAIALGFAWWTLVGVWGLIHVIHFTTYKLFTKP
jgi:hypothetical protein